MDIASILQHGASLIKQNSDQATADLGTDQITSVLGSLLEGEAGKINFGSLLSKMQAGGLADIAASWLGNGENKAIALDAITELFGADKVNAFASKLGLSEQNAKTALASALPEMVDKASPNGSIIENLIGNAGGLTGLADIASKFF